MKRLSYFFGAFLFVFSLALTSCEKEGVTPPTIVEAQEDLIPTDRNECPDLDEVTFEIDYATVSEMVASNHFESELSEDQAAGLLASSECLSTEAEVAEFIARIYSLDVHSTINLINAGRGLQGTIVTADIQSATAEALTQIAAATGEVSPLMGLLREEATANLNAITDAAFENVSLEGLTNDEEIDDRDVCSYFECGSASFPSKKFKIFVKEGRSVELKKRSEGGWLSQYICGYRVYDYPGSGSLKGTRPALTNWQSILLASLHGGSYYFNSSSVFVHRIPSIIVYGYNADCETVKNYVKKAVKAKR